ncbi:MAG: type I glutamate--ammonia ligase [Bacteroidetes bacterium]|nr:type I glutamate--ammonia ligase [Bacteroidota bacterium]
METSILEKTKQLIEKHNIEFIDLKTIDLVGKLHHITVPYEEGILESLVDEGVGFDGSSYGFSKVERSDMILVPDFSTSVIDPFRTAPTLSVLTEVHLTDADKARFSQDGRFVAKKAEEFLIDSGIADTALWGPEFEFYIFSKVEFDTRTAFSFYKLEHQEEFFANAYHAANPFDIYDDFRDEASLLFKQLNIEVKYHHHEVGERGQQEIETQFDTLLAISDKIVLAKYLLFNLAHKNNIYLTFMPKPMFQQAGNGLHIHQYLLKAGKNIFYEKGKYANLNSLAHSYISGLLKHAPALCAFTNPSTNSYKRLVPGFEAPVAITFGQANRSAAIRIPSYVKNPEETRFEYRPPDATANPYFLMSAMLMAGIDGIINNWDPIKEKLGPIDTNIYDTADKNIKFLPKSLEEALDALAQDNEFLKRGNVFTDDLIQQWIKTKEKDIKSIATMPHPYEYKMYFNL